MSAKIAQEWDTVEDAGGIGVAGCVFCGEATEIDEDAEPESLDDIPICHSCNTHGPFGCGWSALDSADLHHCPSEWQEKVWALLNTK